MNTKLILIAIFSAAALSSCTTMYKSGQTPDDVYYSPTRLSGYGEGRKEASRDDAYNDESEYRSVRLGINDRRWRNLDYNYSYNPYISDYAYNPYNYGYNYGYYYNPFFYPYPIYNTPVFVKPSNPKNTTPRFANLGGYNPVYNNSSSSLKNGGLKPSRSYNNSNRGSAVGNAMRQVFAPSNNRSSNSNTITPSNNNNNRTYTPSTSSSSSSSGSSSSGSGAISRPSRN
jgi:hypothetical protein